MADILPRSTTGHITFWGGTLDGGPGYIDYQSYRTNLRPGYQADIIVHDIRHLDPAPSFAQDGYELVHSPTHIDSDILLGGASSPHGKKLVQELYFPECKTIIADITGSSRVFPTSFRLRTENAGTKNYLRADTDGHVPRPVVHIDRDPEVALQTLKDFLGEQQAEEQIQTSSRWAQVNLWRPLQHPATKWPLSFLNHSRIPEWNYDDFTGHVHALNDPRVAERGAKAYDLLSEPDSRFIYHYARDVAPDECLVFSSFDTDWRMVQTHGAFWDDATPPEAPARKSIEMRAFVFFD